MVRLAKRLLLGYIGLIVLGGLILAVLGPRPPAPPAGRPDGSFVEGVVVRVEATGLTAVSGVTLRLDDGRSLTFTLGALRNGVEFPPGHLSEHAATSVRIRVWYREVSGSLEAIWIEDAPAG